MVETSRGPTDVVCSLVAAMESERWEEVVPIVHPGALESFKSAQLQRLVFGEAARNPAIERVQPQLRREWRVAESFRELEALSPAEFLVRYLAASSPRARTRLTLALNSDVPIEPAAVRLPENVSDRRWVVLGEVREGSRIAHVLYRELQPGERYDPETPPGLPPVQVTDVELIDGQWWLSLGGRGLLESQAASFMWTGPGGGAL